MSVKWKKGFNPQITLNKLQEIRTLDGDKVSFSGLAYDEYTSVLKSMIDISDSNSLEVCNGLVIKGFHEAAKRTELKADAVLYSIKKVVRNHNSKREKEFLIVTTINVTTSCELQNVTINKCNIRFYKNLPKKFNTARNKAIDTVSRWLIKKDESFSYFIVAKAKARTEYEAANKIIDTIDLLRGIWNIHINVSMCISSGGGQKKPVNKITLGALQSLHKPDGEKACDTYWYEPNYYKENTKIDFSKPQSKTLEFTNNVRKKIKKSKYKNDIEIAIVRYVRALDYRDYSVSFLKLWGILEYLTSTLHHSYDKTIKRAAFHFVDHDYQIQVLEHLRQYRNKSVHTGSDDNNVETRLYQLKNIVEQLIRFHIGNSFKFASLSDAGDFMDLTPDAKILKEKVKLYQYGIKYCGG